jgi:hypothetical protein
MIRQTSRASTKLGIGHPLVSMYQRNALRRSLDLLIDKRMEGRVSGEAAACIVEIVNEPPLFLGVQKVEITQPSIWPFDEADQQPAEMLEERVYPALIEELDVIICRKLQAGFIDANDKRNFRIHFPLVFIGAGCRLSQGLTVDPEKSPEQRIILASVPGEKFLPVLPELRQRIHREIEQVGDSHCTADAFHNDGKDARASTCANFVFRCVAEPEYDVFLIGVSIEEERERGDDQRFHMLSL